MRIFKTFVIGLLFTATGARLFAFANWIITCLLTIHTIENPWVAIGVFIGLLMTSACFVFFEILIGAVVTLNAQVESVKEESDEKFES